eukprot:gene18242-23915_t
MEQSLRTSLCDIIGELAGFIIEPKDWPEILVYTYNNIQSNDFVKKEIGLSLLDDSNESNQLILKSWVRIARCLGADFKPYLSLVMDKLFQLITQNLSEGTGDIDLNDDTIDERSDIQIVENSDGSYQIMRTSAIEEQSLACQLVVLISEKLQENILLRDSIQKRGLLRAEAQISGGADEDDIADELILMSESLELHFNISEVIGMILRSHGRSIAMGENTKDEIGDCVDNSVASIDMTLKKERKVFNN